MDPCVQLSWQGFPSLSTPKSNLGGLCTMMPCGCGMETVELMSSVYGREWAAMAGTSEGPL